MYLSFTLFIPPLPYCLSFFPYSKFMMALFSFIFPSFLSSIRLSILFLRLSNSLPHRLSVYIFSTFLSSFSLSYLSFFTSIRLSFFCSIYLPLFQTVLFQFISFYLSFFSSVYLSFFSSIFLSFPPIVYRSFFLHCLHFINLTCTVQCTRQLRTTPYFYPLPILPYCHIIQSSESACHCRPLTAQRERARLES